jgi:hypothetical protein
MNNLDKRYPRTLSEAFPNDAEHSYAIIATAKRPLYALHWLGYGFICMFIGFIFGRYL